MNNFAYIRPTTLRNAAAQLGKERGKVMLLAGGTDLLGEMKDDLRVPEGLVAIKHLRELQGIRPGRGAVRIGAATLLDVIDAQAAQTLADSNHLQALYAHANARAMLRFVMAQDPLDPTPGAPATPPEPAVPKASPDAGTLP